MSKVLLTAAMLIATGASHASSTVYTSEAAFLANAGPVAFDSFEDLAPATTAPVPSLARAGYSISTTLGDDPYGLYVFNFATGFGGFATDGDTYLVNQTDDYQSLRFDFDAPVTSFGMSLTDWDNPAMTVGAQLMFGNDAGDSLLITATPLPSGEALFFGIVNASFSFSYVEIVNTASSEAYGIDGVYLTRPVPLPGALGLFGMAVLLGFGPVASRRREPNDQR